MIAIDSKSYPYLAVAQHYNVAYREVLRFADIVDVNKSPPLSEWRQIVWNLEYQRRGNN